MSADQGQDHEGASAPKPVSDRGEPKSTASSIERLLGAAETPNPGILDDDIIVQPSNAATPPEVPASTDPAATDPAPADPAPADNVPPRASDSIPESVAAMRQDVEAARPETDPTVYDPSSRPAETAARDTPPPDTAYQADNAASAPDFVPPEPARRGVFRRKQKGAKPWHRDQAGKENASHPTAPQDAPSEGPDLPEDAAGAPGRRRGPFGLVWSVIRFLLIGKKRPKRKSAIGKSTKRVPGLAGVFRTLGRLRPGAIKFPVPRFIMRLPVLRRFSRSNGTSVAQQGNTQSGAGRTENVGSALASRRDAAESHIRRPLDMSRRVGRSVEIDVEKVRAAGMVTPFGERTHIAEEFRLIKRPLLLNAFEKGPNAIRNGNVIMVASSRSGEGKTFMAVNLAMSIASERDLTVLLIDADVAKPDIPNVLGFEADLGLVDLIADDQIDVSDVIVRTNIENLSVMPAGRPHHLATELLASERMGDLVSELSLRYPERVVIMDSPPALLSSVAGVLALNVGQTLFVVEAERTSQTAVDSAIGLVSACKNINLLLNKSRPLGGGERFGSYQSSYY